jgi:hypothetical protein
MYDTESEVDVAKPPIVKCPNDDPPVAQCPEDRP